MNKSLPECFAPESNSPADLHDSGSLALWTAYGCADALKSNDLSEHARVSLSYLCTELIDAANQRFDELREAWKRGAAATMPGGPR